MRAAKVKTSSALLGRFCNPHPAAQCCRRETRRVFFRNSRRLSKANRPSRWAPKTVLRRRSRALQRHDRRGEYLVAGERNLDIAHQIFHPGCWPPRNGSRQHLPVVGFSKITAPASGKFRRRARLARLIDDRRRKVMVDDDDGALRRPPVHFGDKQVSNALSVPGLGTRIQLAPQRARFRQRASSARFQSASSSPRPRSPVVLNLLAPTAPVDPSGHRVSFAERKASLHIADVQFSSPFGKAPAQGTECLCRRAAPANSWCRWK